MVWRKWSGGFGGAGVSWTRAVFGGCLLIGILAAAGSLSCDSVVVVDDDDVVVKLLLTRERKEKKRGCRRHFYGSVCW